MNAARNSRSSTLAAVLLSLVAYAVADRDPVVAAVGLPAALVAIGLTRGSPSRAMPRWLINFLLFVIVAWATLAMLREGLGVSLFSEFVASLMVVKLMDRRTARDGAQILTLSAFLVIGAVLTSNGFWFGLLLAAYLPVIVAAVLWHQVSRVEEHAAEPPQAPPGMRRSIGLRVAGVALAASLIATVVFLLMPREVGSRTLGAWGAAAVGRVVGFNDEVRLGTGGLISESNEPVLDLQLFDRSGEPVGSVGRRFYLRGAVLDTYDRDAGAWVRGDALRSKFQVGPAPFIRSGPTPVGGARPNDWTLRQEYTIRNIVGERGHLFSIARASQVQVDPPARLEYSPADAALRVQGHSGKVAYTVYSNDQIPPPEHWQEHDPEDRLEVVPDLPEVRDIARRILREAGIEPDPLARSAADDQAAAAALRNFLAAGGFTYTLDTVSAPAGRDPIEWFLNDNREGHCEYFASALAAMLRTVGIDARVITGYLATDFNETTGGYIVRASNAHAWVEAETLPGDWRILDPTPASDLTRIHEPPHGLLADARRFFDTLEFAWIRAVVGYDADRRASLLGGERGEDSVFPVLDRLAGAADRFRFAGRELILRALTNALIAFIAIMGTGLLLAHERRRVGRLLAFLWAAALGLLKLGRGAAPPPPEDALQRGLLAAYRRAGVPKPAWMPLRQHTDDLRRGGRLAGSPAESATRLVHLIYDAIFGGRALPPEVIAQATQDLSTLQRWARDPNASARAQQSPPETPADRR
jgi:transglutaminase-like putative cysteine protease